MNLTVLSVGGSIIAPEKVNTGFLKEFRNAIVDYLEKNKQEKLILVAEVVHRHEFGKVLSGKLEAI